MLKAQYSPMFFRKSSGIRPLQALLAAITLHAVAAYALMTAPQHQAPALDSTSQVTITAHLLAPAAPQPTPAPVVVITQAAVATTVVSAVAAHPTTAEQVGVTNAPTQLAVGFMPAIRLMSSDADRTPIAPAACRGNGESVQLISPCNPLTTTQQSAP